MHPNTARVVTALRAAGADGAASGVRELTDAATTAALAAAALGVEPGAIANSLVFAAYAEGAADPEPVLVMTSGAHRADPSLLAAALGADRVDRADKDLVRAATGYPIGGVAPVGHPRPLRTLVDRALERYPRVWAAGGTPHTVFPTSFAELVRVTGGSPAVVAND